jgi:hypothetical protein
MYRELGVEYNGERLGPEDVRYELTRLGGADVIVVDELDRFEDNDSLSLLDDLVKSLSDMSWARLSSSSGSPSRSRT